MGALIVAAITCLQPRSIASGTFGKDHWRLLGY
jgi:hypothetical protein